MPFPNSSFALAGKYTRIQLIGQGSGGKVYRAVDNVGRVVAVKEALPPPAGFIGALNRFEQEVRVQALLKDRNIIQVYHLEEDPQTHELYLICEYASGGSLAGYLKAHGPLPEQQAIRITLDICAALEEVSARGFVHRDIKPSNILLFTDGQGQISEAKLADFGVAKDLDVRRAGQPSTQRGGSHPGTPEYMAPDQEDITKPVVVRTDLFALGISLWEMLSCTDYKLSAVRGGTPALPTHNPRASPGIAEIIRRAVQDQPADRYPAPRAMAADLQDVLGGRALSTTPTIVIGYGRPPRHFRAGRLGAAVLALVLALGLLVYRAWQETGLPPIPSPASAPSPRGVVDPGGSARTAGSPKAIGGVAGPTTVTPGSPATGVAPGPAIVARASPTDVPTSLPPTSPPTSPQAMLIMTTILTFTSQPEAGRQSIPIRIDRPGRYTLTLTQANPTGPYWMIWDYIGLLQGHTPLWEIGEPEAPPDYTEAAFSEFCRPHMRSACTRQFVVGTTRVADFVYDINASERPDAIITFTITDRLADPATTLVLSSLYATHDTVERFALKVSLARAP